MKQCPQCGSVYSDDTLNFCLTDRASLVAVEGTDDAVTVVRDRHVAPNTQVIDAKPAGSPLFKYIAVGMGVFLLLLIGAGLAALSFWNSRVDRTQLMNAASPTPGSPPARGSASGQTPDTNRAEAPSPSKTPTASPSSTPAPPKEVPNKDPGVSRITFNRGSVSQTVSGTVVHGRSFVLRTMAGQELRASVNSSDGCIEFRDGGKSVEFSTPNGDISLDLTNTCDDPASFSMNVTVR